MTRPSMVQAWRWLILLVGLSPGLRVPEQVSSYSPAHDLPLQVAVAR